MYNFNEKDSKDSYDDSYKHYNFNSTFSYIYIYIYHKSISSPVVSLENQEKVLYSISCSSELFKV